MNSSSESTVIGSRGYSMNSRRWQHGAPCNNVGAGLSQGVFCVSGVVNWSSPPYTVSTKSPERRAAGSRRSRCGCSEGDPGPTGERPGGVAALGSGEHEVPGGRGGEAGDCGLGQP